MRASDAIQHRRSVKRYTSREPTPPEASPHRRGRERGPAPPFNPRRSVKRYPSREPTREEIAALLDAASLAPNHRLTQPWRFYVLGPSAREAYGAALGERKA